MTLAVLPDLLRELDHMQEVCVGFIFPISGVILLNVPVSCNEHDGVLKLVLAHLL